MLRALEAVGDHDTATLNGIEDQLMDLAAPDKDPARARREFTEIYLPARRNQEQLLTEFDGRGRRGAAASASGLNGIERLAAVFAIAKTTM